MSLDRMCIDVRFPAQTLRFLRLSFNLIEQVYMLSEIEVYGEGFAPETSYRTSVIDLGAPVNFGRIFWQFETFRKSPGEPAPTPAPDALPPNHTNVGLAGLGI